ncbi:hypothetical protein JL721_9671 [Aureococcus anophagefferens]|nr:hypothetical protein JL721_9671 [Aureococcus anophagefferens]
MDASRAGVVLPASSIPPDAAARDARRPRRSGEDGHLRDSRHKRRATGGKRNVCVKKRKFESGRQAGNTKIGVKRVTEIRTRGGNKKFRALRLESGNYSWGSEVCTRKTRILDVVYNSTNNELVRTKTLVKNTIVQVDATPFRQWYEAHYGVEIGRKKKGGGKKKDGDAEADAKKSSHRDARSSKPARRRGA